MRRVIRRLIVSYSMRNRRRKAAVIGNFMDRYGVRSLLLVGVGPERRKYEALVEHIIAARANVVFACDIGDARPSWPFVRADARSLPFRERSIDLVLSNAVIEHVGDEQDQQALISEHDRVGRCWVATTPNRWFPVESHTATVFKHWFPRWRRRHPRYRLLSRREFARLLPPGTRVIGHYWAATFVALHSDTTAGCRAST